jgi:hypothetical protein
MAYWCQIASGGQGFLHNEDDAFFGDPEFGAGNLFVIRDSSL